MGRGYEDVKDELRYLPFRVLPGEGIVKLAVGGREVTPPEVSAIVLQGPEGARRGALRRARSRRPSSPCRPTSTTASARPPRTPGASPGSTCVRIVNEPTAASLAYGLHRLGRGRDRRLRPRRRDLRHLDPARQGRHLRGAGDQRRHAPGRRRLRPRAVMLWLLEDIQVRHHAELERDGLDLARDQEAMQELRLAAEAAKIRLSSEERTTLTLPFAGFTYRRDITRAELERLIEPLVSAHAGSVPAGAGRRGPDARRHRPGRAGGRLHAGAAGAAAGAGAVRQDAAQPAQPRRGGGARAPPCRRTSWPAASPTCCCSTSRRCRSASRRWAASSSILIPRNTTIPTSAREMFTTSVDGQTVVDMHVVQGERELAKDCRSLARFELRGIDPMPAGMPKIEVTFLIDANGILQVQARGAAHGQGGVDRGQADLRAHRDRRRADDRGLVHLRRGRRRDAHAHRGAQRGRHRARPRRTSPAARAPRWWAPTSVAEIETAVAALRAAREGRTATRIRDATTAVNRATEHLAEVLMDAALKGALGSQRAAEIMTQGGSRGASRPSEQ